MKKIHKCIYYAVVLFGNEVVNKIPSRRFRLWFYSIMGAKIGKNTVIYRKVNMILPKNLIIGNNCSVGWNVELDARGEILIGNNVNISSYTKFITGSHDIDDKYFKAKFERIVVKDRAWIATGAIILQGVTIGEGSVVCAGAVVTKDVPDFTVVGGVPAKILRNRDKNINYTIPKAPLLH